MANVTLCPITVDNWQACIALTTADKQHDFVMPNLYTIAEDQFYPTMKARAIVTDANTIVGLVWYGRSPRTQQYKVVRLMVDQHHQGKGYGRAAMEAVIADLIATSDASEVWLSYREWNTAARRLYQSLGFQEQPSEPNGRIAACLQLEQWRAQATTSEG